LADPIPGCRGPHAGQILDRNAQPGRAFEFPPSFCQNGLHRAGQAWIDPDGTFAYTPADQA
jgi:hypothetical protein